MIPTLLTAETNVTPEACEDHATQARITLLKRGDAVLAHWKGARPALAPVVDICTQAFWWSA